MGTKEIRWKLLGPWENCVWLKMSLNNFVLTKIN